MAFYNIIQNIIFYKIATSKKAISKSLFSFFLFFQLSISYSQNLLPKDSSASNNDKIEDLLKLDENTSKDLFKENQTHRERLLLFDKISKNIQNADLILKTGIDYKGFTSELDYVIKLKKTAIDGIIKNKNDFQTLRNLTVTSVMLKELQTRVDLQLDKIQKNNLELSQIQSQIDSLTIKKALFILPKDSLRKSLYYERYSEMNSQVKKLNIRFKNSLDSISKLQILATKFKYDLQNDIIETDNIRKNEFGNLLHSDGRIFKASSNKMSFYDSFFYSLFKEFVILAFFISNHFNTLVLMLLLALALIVYLLFLKNKYKHDGLYNQIEFSKRIFKHPIACAILISFTLFNFFFVYPPFAFTALIWLVSIIALNVVNKEYFNAKDKFIWRIFVLLILFTLYDNNILIHSVKEVFLILALAITSAVFSIYNLKKNQNNLNPLFKYSLYALIVFETAAVFFILIDQNYNLGKLLMVNGIITVLMYYLFSNAYRLLTDIINYSNFIREKNEENQLALNKLEQVNFNKTHIALFILCWIITVGKNSYFFHSILDPIIDFFNEQRTVGDINYSYQSILIFFFILILSVIIAKIVSFLTSNSISSNASPTNKFGNWLILVQIAIFTIGISLAFISSGIPVDRLTIIISALGVGIGFGLQTLVNNLVSGLIIAFEKPVNINDTIDIGGQTVKMKSIGIRSSVVATFDGADVIIPNGDLLSQHLTNWTLSNNKKRTDITIGVAYGTNLETTKKILAEILKNHSLVLENPAPIIWFKDFNASSIDVVVKFWVNHINFANDVKSDLIIAIDVAFRENNIQIPFPQHDIHIKKL